MVGVERFNEDWRTRVLANARRDGRGVATDM